MSEVVVRRCISAKRSGANLGFIGLCLRDGGSAFLGSMWAIVRGTGL